MYLEEFIEALDGRGKFYIYGSSHTGSDVLCVHDSRVCSLDYMNTLFKHRDIESWYAYVEDLGIGIAVYLKEEES